MSLSQPKPCPGYMAPGGAATRLWWVGDLFGNNNYQTTGDTYGGNNNAFAPTGPFGLAGIEFVAVMGRSASGTYVISPVFPANSSNSNESQAPSPPSVTFHWYSANGTEVANNTNLAAEIFRVAIFGV